MPDINIGQLAEAINDKMDRDAHNIQSPSSVVIEKQDPTSANDYTWYRKYADGWVEQGGILVVTSSGVAITLPIVMANNTYGCLATAISDTTVDGVGLQMYGRTTTLFYLRNKNYGSSLSVGTTWQVSGMAA